MKFLIDADLPRSTAEAIKRLGFEVVDVRDIGLRYVEDYKILEYAYKNNKNSPLASIHGLKPVVFTMLALKASF